MEEQSQNKKTYEEKKEAKRLEKQSQQSTQQSTQQKQEKTSGIMRTLIVLLILGGIVFLFIRAVQKELPKGEEVGQFFESQSRAHINPDEEHEVYNSNPPTSGSHLGSPAAVGYYSEVLPDERVIHNLEHGDIWIAYHPRVLELEEVMTVLRSFENDGKVIITPREANDFDVSLVAWNWLDGFNIEEGIIETERIEDFIKRYRNRGPEKVNQPRVNN